AAAALYAQDHKERIWDARRQMPPNNQYFTTWARLPDPDSPNQTGPGLVYRYMDNVDKVGECPSNKRRNASGLDGQNIFNTGTALDFDYTMISRMQGAQLGVQTRVAYLRNPAMFSQGTN